MRIKHFISFLLLLVTLFGAATFFAPLVHANAEGVDACIDAIDGGFQSYIFGSGKNAEGVVTYDTVGFLKKIDALYSTGLSGSNLVNEAVLYLREIHEDMDATCSVLRNPYGENTTSRIVPVDVAYEKGIVGCADHEFSIDESLNLALYCDKRMNFYLDFLKDHLRMVILQQSQEQQSTRLVKKYQEINKKLRQLSEDVVQLVQLIVKFNAALGNIITGTCQQ